MGIDSLLVILIVILIIVVMIRGPKTLPLIGGMLGRGVKEVRKGAGELQASQDATTVEQPPATVGLTPQPPATVGLTPQPPTIPPAQPPAAPPTI